MHAPRFSRTDWLAPLLIALPLLLILQGLDIDRTTLDAVYDARMGGFPLRRAWLLAGPLHTWVRVPVIVCGVALLAALVATGFSARWRVWRRPLAYLLFGMVLGAALVAVIKHFASAACPYRLTMYGGTLARLGLFDVLPPGTPAGRCWPGGHASTAFALFPWYFIVRDHAGRRAARYTLAAILGFGLLLTAVQVLRGIHWPSAQVYTALLCWYVALGLHRLMFRHARATTASPPMQF